ncbi:hypothetical protein EDM68_05550 [Candidatus Uhrbacteria bacterium]|nr:MAG: hypothetical protein EDM68_05550 [Candidatus Uhrbacteria bacterium]
MHPAISARGGREYLAIGGLILALLPIYFLLPAAGQGLYASPDETANAVTVRQLAWYGRLSVPEALAEEFPWLHPRSMVSHNETIVPVGFTGWPWILSVFTTFLGQGVLPFLAALFLLSAAFPLFGLLRPFGFTAALLGTLVAFSFPAMIVFGNRGLFPQAAVVGFALWSLFLVTRLRSYDSPWWYGLAGFLCTLAFASRPTEALWLVPWLVWAGHALCPDRKRVVWACAGALIPLAILAFHAQTSYGSFWKSGYMLRDNPSLVVAPTAAPASAPVDETRSLFFPFGFHPRNVLWNVRAYLLNLLLPWAVLLAGVAVIVGHDAWKRRRDAWQRLVGRHAVPLLALWTVGVLIGYYGHGLYTDHVQIGAVTVANSFVRYLLPLGPLIGLAFAFLYARLELKRFGAAVGLLLAVGLSLSGTYTALARDDEGMLTTRREFIRYREIRDRAVEHFGPMDVILSERSDKNFFPNHRAVSPLPPPDEVARLAKTRPELKIGLFARPLSQSQADVWRMAGFEPVELFVSGREKLYLLKPTRR